MLQKNPSVGKKEGMGGSGEVMGTHRRVIARHWEGQTIFRVSTYPVLRGRTLQRPYFISNVLMRHVLGKLNNSTKGKKS